jgi:ABC-type amino acid transport substrate-binding protein
MSFKFYTCMFLTCALFSCTTSEEGPITNHTWEEVQQMGEGIVTLVYVPSDGFSYVDDDGRLTGVTIELVRDFIDYVNVNYNMNVTISYKPVEQFSNFYEAVRDASGGVFGVANVTITDQRKEELSFSPPYMTNIATLITHRDIPEIPSFESIPDAFAGLDALAFQGTLHQERVRTIADQYLPEADIDFAQSNNEIIDRVSSENRYFAYVDIYNYWRASSAGAPLQRHSTGDQASEQFGIIMPLNSDWRHLVERFFEDEGGYLNTERYRYLMETHLGEELAELLMD